MSSNVLSKIKFFELTNLTTKVPIHHAMKKKVKINIVEWNPDSITVELPSKSCGQGHHLMFEIRAELSMTPTVFKATGTVNDIKNLDNRDQISIKLTQYDKMTFDKIAKYFDTHRQKVDQLFTRMKE